MMFDLTTYRARIERSIIQEDGQPAHDVWCERNISEDNIELSHDNIDNIAKRHIHVL